MDKEKTASPMHENPSLIIGRNAVSEALRADREIDKLYVQRGAKGSLVPIIAKAREKGIIVKETDSRKLDFMSNSGNHQGIIASAAVKEYASIDDALQLAEERGEKPFLIICDELEDPHNLGAIIRTAEGAGAHGVIIPERRSAGLSFTVGKASAGAVEYVPVIKVRNISETIGELQDKGLWIYAADMDGEPWSSVDYSGALALVIGSEGKGIGRLIKEKSDFIITLPMKGHINSLNASVAAGILCYEVSRQRSKIKAINP